jgi:hypothetical protein
MSAGMPLPYVGTASRAEENRSAPALRVPGFPPARNMSRVAAPIASGRSEQGAGGTGYPWNPETFSRRTLTPISPQCLE